MLASFFTPPEKHNVHIMQNSNEAKLLADLSHEGTVLAGDVGPWSILEAKTAAESTEVVKPSIYSIHDMLL